MIGAFPIASFPVAATLVIDVTPTVPDMINTDLWYRLRTIAINAGMEFIEQ